MVFRLIGPVHSYFFTTSSILFFASAEVLLLSHLSLFYPTRVLNRLFFIVFSFFRFIKILKHKKSFLFITGFGN